ncbi:MAG TPA: PD-(D/E)XK nuclease family protein, partial [Candidatus Hypogeohydataceae bacterium YC40]
SFGRERYEDRSIVYEDVRTAPSLPPLRLRDKNGNIVLLTGRIDRIDVAEIDGESLGLVVDYKYSREIKNESKTREEIIEEGTDLQLPIYILVAKNLLGLKPIGAQFFTLKSPGRSGIVSVPLPNKCEHIPQEELEALLESC